MFPYLDFAGVQLRSVLRPQYFSDVELLAPGYTIQSIASHSSAINSRLRKRYGGGLPWGQQPPELVASGVAPPAVALTGVATLGSILVVIQITTAGALGTAVFQWSSNGGATWTTGVATAASVALGTTGLSAVFPPGAYLTSHVYSAAPPVPETILRWLTTLVTWDVLRRHGPARTGDDIASGIKDEVDLVQKQIEDAANTQTGLWDLPASEDAQSAVSAGAPLSYSEASPYEWSYRHQACAQGLPCPLPCPPNRIVGG